MDARVPEKGDAPVNSQTKESYETVGMHRLIGGFYYNFFLYIFAMIFFILMFTVILPLFMPYPEIEGYSRIVYGLLGFAFGFFDFGSTRGTTSPENSAQLADGLLRFLGEHATTNPGRAFKYVQFFAWFQMFTGMIQITIISLIVLVWFPITNMAHLTWFVLGYLLIQFPGCTQIFDSIFKGFQRFNAYSIYTFLKDTVIRYAMMIAGVTLGRYWGAKNPQIGEIVGATIGYILSLYGIEICTFILGCIFYRIMLGGDAGWRVIDIFIPTFDREIAKQVLTFSGKLWVGTLLSQFWMLLENVLILTLISQYGVWMGLISFANQISSIVTMQGVMVRNSTATLAEAYMNDKHDLFRYYVLNLIRYNSFITIGLLIPFVVLFPPVLDSLIGLIPDLSNYEPLVYMLPMIFLFEAIASPVNSLTGRLFTSTNRPLAGVFLAVLNGPFKLVVLFLFSRAGYSWEAIIISLFLQRIFSICVQMTYFHVKILKIPFKNSGFLWQTFAAPVLAGAITWGLMIALDSLIFAPLLAWSGMVAGILILLFSLFIFPMFIYSPIFALMGGLGRHSLDQLKQAIPLCGPSKFVLKGTIRAVEIVTKIPSLYDRFPLPLHDAYERERREIMKSARNETA